MSRISIKMIKEIAKPPEDEEVDLDVLMNNLDK